MKGTADSKSWRRNKKALVVDDNSIAQLVIKRLLEEEGYEVVTANNGAEAITLFDGSFILIVIDYNMPLMNGVDATRIIRQKEKNMGGKKSLLIFGLTADTDPEIIRLCREAGMDNVFEKPIAPEKFKKII